MVGDYDLLGETRKKMKDMSPLSYEKGFDALFQFISLKLYMFESLGLKRYNVGELKAWIDILDMLVNLSARVGYDDSNVVFADHAIYNHKKKMDDFRKMIEENYVR